MTRLLAIFAHPDDESLLAGGTLAACAAAGMDVQVVSLTRGEQGPIALNDVAREQLGAVRERELHDACAALGVHGTCLRFPDGELEWAAADDAVRRMVRIARPDIVITFGPEGWYWHPDHIATYRLVMAALDRCTGASPWVYGATWPQGLMNELVRALQIRGRRGTIWGLDPSAFGVPADTISTVVDVAAFVPARLQALRSHRSQLDDGHILAHLPLDLARDVLGREYFVLARRGGGPDPLAPLALEAVHG